MRFAFIDVEKALYPLRLLCRVLRVSRSGYYAWRVRRPSDRALEDERLRPKVVEAFKTGRGTYGNPRVLGELIDQGFDVGRRRIARLMRDLVPNRVVFVWSTRPDSNWRPSRWQREPKVRNNKGLRSRNGTGRRGAAWSGTDYGPIGPIRLRPNAAPRRW
jgi:hypothetical protein